MACVYLITNTVNGKQYVGQTFHTAEERFTEHLHSMRQGNTKPLYNSMRKHGVKNFEVQTMFFDLRIEDLDTCEQYLIRELNTRIPNGYNLTDGGYGPKGMKHSEETKAKISETLKSPEVNEKLRQGQLGRKHTDEHRRKQSESNIGRHNVSEETSEKLRQAGTEISEETRKKRSLSVKAYWEAKKKAEKEYKEELELERKIAEAEKKARELGFDV